VQPERIPIDLNAGTPSATSNTITVGGASYSRTLGPGQAGGFHVVTLDRLTLRAVATALPGHADERGWGLSRPGRLWAPDAPLRGCWRRFGPG
jgi:hypothetical protein